MAKVEFTRVETDEEVENLDIKDGRFIVTGEGKAFIDYGENRIGIGGTPDTQMSDSSTNSVENRVIKGYVDNEIEDVKDLIPNLSNTYGTSNENGYTQEYINSVVSDTTTGNFTLNSNVSNGFIQYVKIGKFVQIQTEFILNSSAIPSGTWKTINLGTTSNDLKPKINTNIVCRRDTGGQTYIINIDTNGNISIKDRGTGNLQASENILCNGFYIIA